MEYFVSNTDYNWFKFLSELKPDEVNFWRPSGLGFSAVTPGSVFLFKLHKPINKIVGGGYFIRTEKIPMLLAWDAFKEKNGARTAKELKDIINKYRNNINDDPIIACIILNQPFFFNERDWIDIPENWSSNIVVGKVYDNTVSYGKKLWDQVVERIPYTYSIKENLTSEPLSLYGAEYLAKSRLGQGAFKILVTSAYTKRCAVSGEKALPVLQAAHIRDFSEQGPNKIENGLLLRSDIHILFDRGYLTITNDYKVEVSRRIKEEFQNGKNYYAFHGKSLHVLPREINERPAIEYIRWHNDNRYKG